MKPGGIPHWPRQLRGSHSIPILVRRWNSEVTLSTYQSSPEDTYGGAGRLVAAMKPGGPNVIKYDTGSYFYGSGLFFPFFGGRKINQFFAESGYTVYSLQFRDFTAGTFVQGQTSARFLGQYIERARERNTATPPAVVSNINITGTYLNDSHITPYTLVALSDGRQAAFLSLLDPQHMEGTVPDLFARTQPYDVSVHATLALLRRLSSPPDVIVYSISARSGALTSIDDTLPGSTVTLRRLMETAVGIDVWLLEDFSGDGSSPFLITNWAGDPVLAVPLQLDSHGREWGNYTVNFDSGGFVVESDWGWRSAIALDNTQPSDPATEAIMVSDYQELELELAVPVGALGSTLEASRSALTTVESCSAAATLPTAQSAADWGLPEDGFTGLATVCGCRVTECSLGNFIADSVREFAQTDVAMVNSGAIRAALSAGNVTRGNLLSALPFLNTIISMTVSGEVIREMLTNSISRLGGADAAEDPSGRFLQVRISSRAQQIKWYAYHSGYNRSNGALRRAPPCSSHRCRLRCASSGASTTPHRAAERPSSVPRSSACRRRASAARRADSSPSKRHVPTRSRRSTIWAPVATATPC